MASKKKQKLKLQAKHAQQAQTRPSQRLDEAQTALLGGNAAQAIDLVTKALNANLDPSLRTRALALLAEAHFRAAASTHVLEDRLAHLEIALRLAPQQARLHHHAGVTLLHLGRASTAKQAFVAALKLAPNRPGLSFLHQLARIVDGESAVTAGLSTAEVNSLHLAQALMKTNGSSELSEQFIGQSLVGQADGLWQLLLQMVDQPKSAPSARFASELAAAQQLAHSPIAAYYSGVVALRKGDKTAALPIWRRLADEGQLTTAWFTENTALLTRERASTLAEAQQWQDVIALQPSDLATVTDNVLAEVLAAAHFQLGYAASEAGDWAQAVQHWEQANHLAKVRSIAQNLALALERLGRWSDAATAWREMVRRRPRKSDQPDSLTDDQVAAIWLHAADCYGQIDNSAEEIACLKNALKYKETDPDLRLRLVDAYVGDQRMEAARNELERLLEISPDHVPALTRLGAIYQNLQMGDATSIWRRVVALEPANQEARNALADCIVESALARGADGWLGRLTKRSEKQQIKILQDGLKELPGHPKLLLEIGMIQQSIGDHRAARGTLRQAWEAAPTDPEIVGMALHDLLHAKGEAIVEELLPSVRNIPGLLTPFWLDQAERAMHCELDERWVSRFFEEAIDLAKLNRNKETLVLTLIRICDVVFLEDPSPKLRSQWEDRARRDGAHAGLGEYVDARYAAEVGNHGKAIELLRKGAHLANKAGEPMAAEMMLEIVQIFSQPANPFAHLLDKLSPDELLEILKGMDMDMPRGRRRR